MSTSSHDIESVTLQAVDHFVEEGFLFTALDISNLVKKSLPGVRHREVAPIVRELFDEGKMGKAYQRTIIDVEAQGKTVQALLYHHEDDDADEYAGTQRQQQATVPVPVAQIAAAVQANAPSQCPLDIGKDGRARLALSFIRAAQITGTRFDLSLDQGGPDLALATAGQGGGSPLATLELQHPLHLHIPLNHFQGFDLTRGLIARQQAGRVRLTQG